MRQQRQELESIPFEVVEDPLTQALSPRGEGEEAADSPTGESGFLASSFPLGRETE
jgi:hypothetical protein